MNILVFVGLLSYSWAFPSQPRKQKLQDSLTQGGLYIVSFLYQVQSKQYGNDVLILIITNYQIMALVFVSQIT